MAARWRGPSQARRAEHDGTIRPPAAPPAPPAPKPLSDVEEASRASIGLPLSAAERARRVAAVMTPPAEAE